MRAELVLGRLRDDQRPDSRTPTVYSGASIGFDGAWVFLGPSQAPALQLDQSF